MRFNPDHMNQPSESIDQLVHLCLRGDQNGFAALYENCAPMIYRLCYGLLMNREDAEDVMQEAFVYAFRNLYRFDPKKASFRTWLYTIALSRCRNMYRRSRWARVASLLSIELSAPYSEAPEARLADHDAKAVIEKALSALTPRLREAVVLRYGHGLTFREMAEIIGCPQKTAESRVRLAHEQLRTVLQPSGEYLLSELIGIEYS